MTTPQPAPSTEPETPRLPADPQQYDDERNVHARARGLAAPYIAGGRDPDPEAGRAEERRLLRLLVAMVVTLVLSGFVIGIVARIIDLVV